MRYRLLGNSGLRVSELCLGTMTFGEGSSWGASKHESRKMFELFADAGGNFLDTANIYAGAASEELLGEILADERDRFVLASKYSLTTDPDDVNASGNHRKSLARSLEASLRRLRTDYIDLYFVHAWDFMTPVEEVMRALDDAVSQGKILYAGISDTPAWVTSQAQMLATLRGWSPLIATQVRYSLIDRSAERDLIPMAESLNLGVTVWGALGGGFLSGKYDERTGTNSSGEPGRLTEGDPSFSDKNRQIIDEVRRIATEVGATPSQIAINWMIQKSRQIIPIIGGRTAAQLKENLGSLDFRLDSDHHRRLNEVSRIELGFPHDFLRFERFRKRFLGNTMDLIDR